MLKKNAELQGLQARAGRAFAALPITPNQITSLSIFSALAAFCLAYLGLPIHSLALFILSGALDALDGAVARAKGMVSRKGAYIDGISDRLVEFLFILSFFSFPLPNAVLPAWLSLMLILFFGSAMTSFATAYAEHRHVADSKKISCQPGILPRAERLILLFTAFLAAPFHPFAASILLFLIAILCTATFAQRFAYYAR
ncbi:MAG: CDP-alcohol phosphatidyltransferase family protein [Candidatus Micrarchaeia archaeon]